MKVILETKSAEIVEKKSRFISTIYYATNVEECEKVLLNHKKKYYDAKHNCYAYILGIDGREEKSSDDGEPQGTAGHPMLDILKGEKLTYTLAVVTRYFGGILLGTGGLVRSYSDSLKKALANATFANIEQGHHISFSLKYDEYGAFTNILKALDSANFSNFDFASKNVIELKKEFSSEITLEYIVNVAVFDLLNKKLIDLTKGRVELIKTEIKSYYLNKNNDIIYV